MVIYLLLYVCLLGGSQSPSLTFTRTHFFVFARLIRSSLTFLFFLLRHARTNTHVHFLFVSPGVHWSRCMSSRELITALMRMITAHLSSSTSSREHLLLSVWVCVQRSFCIFIHILFTVYKVNIQYILVLYSRGGPRWLIHGWHFD